MNYIKKYPMDIILCLLCLIFLIPFVLFDIKGIIRIFLGLPFLVFIPGYLFIYALFPARKISEGIDTIERIVLSIAFSITSTSLVTLGLNYTSFGIKLESIFVANLAFSIIFAILALYRRNTIFPEERFTLKIKMPFKITKNNNEKILDLLLFAVIILCVLSFFYVISNQENGETFTEFYLLGSNYEASDYPLDLVSGENASLLIGISNHEFRDIDYSVEVWLINETSINGNNTIYHNAWFIDKFNVFLGHIDIDMSGNFNPQWLSIYNFSINKTKGHYKLAFLLYDSTTEEYEYNRDYSNIIEEKLASAYRQNHLWINFT